jgi:Tfp pilus assembly protein PilV
LGAKQGHAKAAKRDRFSASSFLKFRIPHFAFPNKISPFRTLRRLREQSVLQSLTTNLPFRPWRLSRESSAFSLTEVVIAMGVAAVAFTSIIALFPLGLNMSKESYEETQAALLAQTILSDLKDQQVGSKNQRYSAADGSPYSFKLIQIAGNVDPQIVKENYLGVDLRILTVQNVYLAYDAKTRTDTDATSQPIMLRPSAGTTNIEGWYDGSKPSNGLAAVAKVTFVPTFSITTVGNDTGVVRVDISIETPGSAKPENRTVRMYTGAVCP